MEDLFKKIPSIVKSSSKRSSSSSSRSKTPSPPPTTLPPPLPTPDIPIQLPVGQLLPPPLITAGNSLGIPIGLPLPSLTQTAVFQRDRAARVFEHSPLSNQLSLSNCQYQQQERIEKQRGRYRFRGESADTRKSPSRSLSPRGKPKEKVERKTPHGILVPPLSSTTPSEAEGIPVKEPRPGPATTFEEILSIDGTDGASLDDFAICVSGSLATAFRTDFTTRRMRKDRITRIVKAYSDSAALSWAEEGYPATECTQPLPHYKAYSPTSPISAAAELGIVFNCSRNETELPLRSNVRIRVSTGDETHPQETMRKFVGPKCIRTDLGLHMSFKDDITRLPSPVSDVSAPSTKHKPYIPQVDGSFGSQPPNLSDPTSAELPGLPDPFGLRAAIPTEDAVRIAEEGRQVSFLQRCKDFFTSNSRNIKARGVQALMTGPDMNNNNTHVETNPEEPGETEEDIGTRKAKAVARSWNRSDLVVCYSWLVALTTSFVFFEFGHFFSSF